MSTVINRGGFRQTVGHAIRAVLPEGTQPGDLEWLEDELSDFAEGDCDQDSLRWCLPPFLPSDVFAASAYLCKIGGVIPFFEPSPFWEDQESCRFSFSVDERTEIQTAAKVWRDPELASVVPDFVFDLWDDLVQAWDDIITPGAYFANGNETPDWWRAAVKLVVISDLACDGLFNRGHEKVEDDKARDTDITQMDAWLDRLFVKDRSHEGDGYRPPATITMMADTSIVCVLPKVRVAAVGATLRNMSRNLCLLPGRGEVRCYWESPVQAMPSENSATLDVLLIPEPRELKASDFVPHADENISEKELHEQKHAWEYFDLEQSWISDCVRRAHFLKNGVALLKKAKLESRSVNAVVLPEYALDYDLFDRLCELLKDEEPCIEFVVSGASDNCYNESGNHVLTRIWYQDSEQVLTQSRPKHHRWRVDRAQIGAYALGASLNPKIENWWENTPLGRRELHFQRFRKSSVLSVLICEELARSDPCHQILRAVAPNLIIALLLDGPQLKSRWPAQYASNLADDPGSGVLTFTSFGLIDRSNKQGHYPEAKAIALWKDDSGQIVEIAMPKGKGMRGVLLSLWSEHTKDQTLCGDTRSVRAWRYSGHFPITLEK